MGMIYPILQLWSLLYLQFESTIIFANLAIDTGIFAIDLGRFGHLDIAMLPLYLHPYIFFNGQKGLILMTRLESSFSIET